MAEEKKKAIAEKKRARLQKGASGKTTPPARKQRRTSAPAHGEESSSSEEDQQLPVRVHTVFLSFFTLNFLEVGDFVLVELQLQEGKHSGTPVCYVARVEAVLEGDLLELKFLRLKNPPIKDTFTFPPIDDTDTIAVGQVKGVLDILTRSTARQANLVKVKHPLVTFNVK